MNPADFIARFKYRKGLPSLFGRDIRKTAIGDCQDFSWTVLILETGGKLQALKAMLTFRAVIWRCWSPQNGLIPRHAVLQYRGNFIDSTTRYWRANATPHRRAYPTGLPVLIGLAAALWGLW